MHTKFNQLAEEIKEEVVDFAVKLVQTPSTSGKEKELADLCLAKMKSWVTMRYLETG